MLFWRITFTQPPCLHRQLLASWVKRAPDVTVLRRAKMPKSKREQLTAFLTLEILVEGFSSEARNLRNLPFSPSLVTRVIRALQDAKVIDKINYGKYIFANDFLRSVSADVFPRMPRGGLTQYPVMTVFDLCRMEEWRDDEFEAFIKHLRYHRAELQKWRADGVDEIYQG